MAESSVSLSQDQFSCSICLDLLKDPAAIPCGHSYCMSCITDYWDQDDQKRVYSCPQCRQTFNPRPVLGKNTMLAEVVEKMKKTKLQVAQPTECYAGPEDVECDVCTQRKHKAVKSCMVCLISYCQNHLEQHENLFKGKRHNLMDASMRLQEMICPQHDKLMEIYCRTDQQCICILCMVDKHKNHDTVSASAEGIEKQRQLQESQKTTKQRIQQREKELQKLRETVESHKRTAQAAVEDSERIFTELIRSIERSRSEVTQLIRDQEKAAVSRAEGLLEQLEQEIADLRRRDAELEELSHTEDHIHFLQSFQSLSIPPGLTDLSRFTIPPIITFGDVTDLVLLLRENVEDLCRQEMKKISGIVIFLELVSTSEPNTREEFLQYSHQLTLDANTAYEYLCLSEGNRVITESDTAQPCPDHPDRFDSLAQVLCRESMWGCCYWEVEWKGRGVGISVSYKSISRKGRSDNCAFGYNNQSWSLYCFPTSYSKYSFWHNHIETELPVISTSSRIGVFLDTIAGTLSFYSISDTMTLIHRVHTTFTQPLYPGFRIYGSLKLCNLAK